MADGHPDPIHHDRLDGLMASYMEKTEFDEREIAEIESIFLHNPDRREQAVGLLWHILRTSSGDLSDSVTVALLGSENPAELLIGVKAVFNKESPPTQSVMYQMHRTVHFSSLEDACTLGRSIFLGAVQSFGEYYKADESIDVWAAELLQEGMVDDACRLLLSSAGAGGRTLSMLLQSPLRFSDRLSIQVFLGAILAFEESLFDVKEISQDLAFVAREVRMRYGSFIERDDELMLIMKAIDCHVRRLD